MKVSFYVGARSDENNGGIYGYDDACSQVCFQPVRGVSYMAFSPDKTLMYAVQKDGDDNYAAVYKIHEDGTLEYADRRPTYGISSCHLTTDPDGRFLYCANYFSGTLNEFRLKNGLFQGEDATRTFVLKGTLGPNTKRQEHTHAHCTVFTPDGHFLCVCDLGADEVQLFHFDLRTGIDEIPVYHYHSARPGAGPRHLLFAPNGSAAWLANELDGTVSVLQYKEGTLTHVNTLSTLPDDFTEKNTVAAVRLSPDGRFLFVSNRGHNSIACFKVEVNGDLERYALVPVEGVGPRDINFTPDGKGLVSCNEGTDNVTFFDFNAADGSLHYRNRADEHPGPLCMVFPALHLNA